MPSENKHFSSSLERRRQRLKLKVTFGLVDATEGCAVLITHFQSCDGLGTCLDTPRKAREIGAPAFLVREVGIFSNAEC